MPDAVLVTGGSGFIGTWVVRELLHRQMKVVVLDSQLAPERWKRVLGDRGAEVMCTKTALTDRDGIQQLIEQNGIRHVIHLAALLTPACQQDPFLGCQVNVLGSTAVFDAARRSGKVKAIAFASSFAVYGADPSEKSLSQPPMFYGAFKQSVDLIAEQYWLHFGLPSVAVRPHVAYGPERDQGLTAGPSLACRAAIRGESYVIGYTGSAGYDYVEDVARAFVRSVFECPRGATIVDLPGAQATTEDFVRLIESVVPEIAGRITVGGPPIPTNIPPICRDIRQVLTDWQPTPLADGVRKTIEFYQPGGR